MKREILIALTIAALVAVPGAAGFAGKFYLEHTYVKIASLAEQTNQTRIWQLQDKIDGTRRAAQRQNRSLTTYEKEDIQRWSSQIRRLRGTPQ